MSIIWSGPAIIGDGWKATYFDPHERWQVLVRYSDMLSAEQRDQIKNAPDNAVIRIETERGKITCVMAITPEMIRDHYAK
jgi:hypothetical protein